MLFGLDHAKDRINIHNLAPLDATSVARIALMYPSWNALVAASRIAGRACGGMLDGSWTRLKACLDTGCGWAFYDRSRNRSGQWCDTTCGSRHKVRAYRARRRHTATQ